MLTAAVRGLTKTAGRADVRTLEPSRCLQLFPLSDVFSSVSQPQMKVWAASSPLQTRRDVYADTPMPTNWWNTEAASLVLLLHLGSWKEELGPFGDWPCNPVSPFCVPRAPSPITPQQFCLGVRTVTTLAQGTTIILQIFCLSLMSIRLIGLLRESTGLANNYVFYRNASARTELLACGLCVRYQP